MNILLLSLSILITDPSERKSADSILNSMSWLEHEWTKSYSDQFGDIFDTSPKLVVVSATGKELLRVNEEDQVLDLKQRALLNRSDFLFETNTGDKYYLAD